MNNEKINQLISLKAIIEFHSISTVPKSRFTDFQHDFISSIKSITRKNLDDNNLKKTIEDIINLILFLHVRDEAQIFDETLNLIIKFKEQGLHIDLSKDLQSAGPISVPFSEPVFFDIFVDESGSDNFDEREQPVFCLVGIIMPPDKINVLSLETDNLLIKFGLPKETEIHCKESLDGTGPFINLEKTRRYELLKEFLTIGMKLSSGVHYLAMAKNMVQVTNKENMKKLGLNPYSKTVILFAITLELAYLEIDITTKYRYFYDRTDANKKNINRIFRILKNSKNPRFCIKYIYGDPIQLESYKSRGIQLADVAGCFFNRHSQLEIKTMKPKDSILKYQKEINEMYEIMKPKLVNFIHNNLPMLVDWDALNNFSLKYLQPEDLSKPKKERRKN